jgi:putative Holliday junction resolvase
MENNRVYLGLDVGEQRIGVARGDAIGRIAQPITTILANDADKSLAQLVHDTDATDIVIGRPRNQSGDTTNQTSRVQQFVAAHVQPLQLPVHWQDESVTSVIAEERLKQRNKPYQKADIDAEAASIILQDFLELL